MNPPEKNGKHIYTVKPELWCRYPKADGTLCRAPKKLYDNGTRSETCAKHADIANDKKARALKKAKKAEETAPLAGYARPEPLPLQNLRELAGFLADCMQKVRTGDLEPKRATPIASLSRELFKTYIALEKLDPEKAARRQATYEEIMTSMKSLTVDEARRLAMERGKRLEEALTVQVVTEEPAALPAPSPEQQILIAAVEDEIEKMLNDPIFVQENEDA